ANKALQKALTIREEHGPSLDIAATRDNIGALREAQGRFEEAKEIRLKGEAKDMIMCGYYDCTARRVFALRNLISCDACGSVFYCSSTCRIMDWNKRHKPLCEARKAAEQAGAQSEAQPSTGEASG
ncbi:hypothetical protein F4804DRAFT_338460, partial [Jackrogersella minutella]